MLVGTAPGPLIAAVVELTGRSRVTGLDTHAAANADGIHRGRSQIPFCGTRVRNAR